MKYTKRIHILNIAEYRIDASTSFQGFNATVKWKIKWIIHSLCFSLRSVCVCASGRGCVDYDYRMLAEHRKSIQSETMCYKLCLLKHLQQFSMGSPHTHTRTHTSECVWHLNKNERSISTNCRNQTNACSAKWIFIQCMRLSGCECLYALPCMWVSVRAFVWTTKTYENSRTKHQWIVVVFFVPVRLLSRIVFTFADYLFCHRMVCLAPCSHSTNETNLSSAPYSGCFFSVYVVRCVRQPTFFQPNRIGIRAKNTINNGKKPYRMSPHIRSAGRCFAVWLFANQ